MPKIRVGSAEIDLTLKTGQYNAAVERVRKRTKTMKDSMVEAATKTRSLTAALAGIATVGFVSKQIFEIGAAAEEIASKFSTVFGPAADDVQLFIDRFGTMAGLSNTAARDVTATTGAIAQGMGFARDASAAFAIEVVRLAGDLSSFNNIPIEETSRAIQAALTGERESLKRLGIVVMEADVQQRALAMSGKDVVGALTQQEKAAATLQLITERAGVAVGDLARTQDSAANQARRVAAEVANIKEQLAVALLPVLSVAVEGFGKFIKGMQIMGAEAAVLVARMNFWKEAAFGTEESTIAANDQLRLMRQAAEEVKNSIVGLTFELGNFSDSAGNLQTRLSGSGGGLVLDMSMLTQNTNLLDDSLLGAAGTSARVAAGLDVVASAANNAASAQDRLNSAMSKFNAVSGALGFLGRHVGALSFLGGPLGLISGGLGAVSGLTGAFGGGGTQTEEHIRPRGFDPTLTVRIEGISDGTTRVVRSKLSALDGLDVGLVI